MAVEIERKFLVDKDFSIKLLNGTHEFIWQAYLLSDEGRNVRIRKKGDKAFITFKSGKDSLSRKEFEYEIPFEDFSELKIIFKDFPSIEKNRYFYNYEGMLWEIDVFEGLNKGLIVAEIELENESQEFKKPEWLGQEVTNKLQYSNSFLSKNPYSAWENKL